MLLPLALSTCGREPESMDLQRRIAALLPSECEVHHLPLGRDVVPQVYGLIRESAPGWSSYLAIREAEFPHHGFVAFGGCVASPSGWAEVLVCERCRERELEWERELDAQGRSFVFDSAWREARIRWTEALEPREQRLR